MSNESKYASDRNSSRVQESIQRVSENLTKLLVDQLRAMEQFAKKSEPLRKRIVADVKSITETIPESEPKQVLEQIVNTLRNNFHDEKIIASLGSSLAAKARSKHTVKVDGEGSCLGAQGFGVTVSINGTSAGACVTGTPGNITGGGISGGFSY